MTMWAERIEALRDRRSSRRRALRDSAAARRRRSLAGLTLAAIGVLISAAGLAMAQVSEPAAVEVSPNGTTELPQVHFFQNSWVLFGRFDNSRRVPPLEELGCSVTPAPSTSKAQPTKDGNTDFTAFGSRVIGEVPVNAIAVLGRPGANSSITCARAHQLEPLWAMARTSAPSFTPIGIVIGGVLIMVAGALVHPTLTEFSVKRRKRK